LPETKKYLSHLAEAVSVGIILIRTSFVVVTQQPRKIESDHARKAIE
jgi:hypothetical protein